VCRQAVVPWKILLVSVLRTRHYSFDMIHKNFRYEFIVPALTTGWLLAGCCPDPKPCPTVPPCPEPTICPEHPAPKQCLTRRVKVTFDAPPKFVPPCAVGEPNLNGHPAISFSHTLRTSDNGRSVEAVVSIMAMNGEGYASGTQTFKVFTLPVQEVDDGWRISDIDTTPDHYKVRMSSQSQSANPPGANLATLQLYGDTRDNECGTYTGASWSYREVEITQIQNDGTCIMPNP
jgi:hypothetical protein